MLNLKRGFVPACLTLSALLAALPASADTPAAPSVQASAPQMIRLQHVVPADVIKKLHWEQPSQLPAGVTQIVSVPLQNALLVIGSPSGIAQVREIARLLDIVPRPVQIKFALAHASEADLKSLSFTLNFDLVPLTASDFKQGLVRYASGYRAARFLQMLALRQAVTGRQAVTEGPEMTAANNVETNATLSVPGLPAFSQQVRVTPRINTDDSVTLNLHASFSEGAGKREVSTLRTIKDGEMLLLIMPPASENDQNLLLFVTPTVK